MRAFRLAYDGRPFHGFQRQPDVPTVEDALFDALRELGVLGADADAPPGYAGAGRTDAGVSAFAQTVAFSAPDWLTPAALNSGLPATVRAWARAEAPAEFHATHDATSRSYRYHLHAPPDAVSDERARDALDALRGEHDFHNLTPDDTGTVRTLDGSLSRDGAFLVVELTAGGFARQLVRRVVSLVASIARGDRDLAAVDRVLASAQLPGPKGVPPAAAYPLVLVDVTYPDLDFTVDADAKESARTVFADRRDEHRTRARVADELVAGLRNRP
ncbi:tRNA pseudouridine(38-40) synthase TruA [Halorientalis brevis]|uniref:tRNA pseudouridine synthase A n=1 Tax=Halorientalis brevis TaxID=1126241 RepID=A0ABD6C6M3_9EURY|nr:tRNA pseudouridine(38-40) synthase TruA [Halorientalis brevis]